MEAARRRETIVVEEPLLNDHGLSARAWLDEEPQRVSFRASVPMAARGADPFLPALLIPAMRLGATMKMEGEVSQRLLDSVPTIEDILHAWDRGLSKVRVEARASSEPESRNLPGVATFFSGGVDSFFTLLKHRSEITGLIFVHGFDLKLKEGQLRSRISEAIRTAAQELGLPIIEVETNLRHFSGRYASWERLYFGPALASVALFLSPLFRKVYIPSGLTYAGLSLTGSHPLLDPLWSTEDTELVHDGSESTRVEKVASIAKDEVAMRWLRVCTANLGGSYNCGRCEKCLRTMVSLRVAGALERCSTLPNELDLKSISRLDIHSEWQKGFLVENLWAVRMHNRDAALERALRKRLARYERRAPIENYLRRRLRPLYDKLPSWAQQRFKR